MRQQHFRGTGCAALWGLQAAGDGRSRQASRERGNNTMGVCVGCGHYDFEQKLPCTF